MSSEAEENKALVHRFFEARVKMDMDALEKMLADDFVSHTRGLPGHKLDREGYKRMSLEFAAALSNSSFIVEEQVAEGEKVVSRYTVHATHDGREFLGVAPTGRQITCNAIFIHRIEGGKIVEERSLGTVAQKLVEQRLEQERVERERLEQELRVARSIQQASLPKEVPTPEDWQINPYYQPARQVGGDFYDFHLLPEGKLGLAVGDATGKGVPAALVMSTTCGMLRLAAQSYSSPGQILQRVNEALCPYIPQNMFVTCFYAIVDPKSATLSYANAGHNLPCCSHDDQAVTELEARGMPLGLLPEMSYEEKESVLVPGESILFYTDGLVEAHNPEGEMFGTPRLRGLLSESYGVGSGFSVTLMEELVRFTGERWEQGDDITLLTLRSSAARS